MKKYGIWFHIRQAAALPVVMFKIDGTSTLMVMVVMAVLVMAVVQACTVTPFAGPEKMPRPTEPANEPASRFPSECELNHLNPHAYAICRLREQVNGLASENQVLMERVDALEQRFESLERR